MSDLEELGLRILLGAETSAMSYRRMLDAISAYHRVDPTLAGLELLSRRATSTRTEGLGGQ